MPPCNPLVLTDRGNDSRLQEVEDLVENASIPIEIIGGGFPLFTENQQVRLSLSQPFLYAGMWGDFPSSIWKHLIM